MSDIETAERILRLEGALAKAIHRVAKLEAAMKEILDLQHGADSYAKVIARAALSPAQAAPSTTKPGAFDYWPATEEGNWGDDELSEVTIRRLRDEWT
jgi:hypothetical protein